MSGWIVVFAKAPRAGAVKTRLTPPLEPEQAASLYRCLLGDALAVTADAARRLDAQPLLAADPGEARAELVRRAPPPFGALAQRGSGLGARLRQVVAQAAAAGGLPILVRGSDSPTLDAASLASAWRALERCDLVLRPDRDGGYSLIGLRRPVPELFDHPMSSDSLLERTLGSARSRGLRTHTLATGFDLDRVEDLAALAAARSRQRDLPCPRTLAYLDSQRLWELAGAAPAARFAGND